MILRVLCPMMLVAMAPELSAGTCLARGAEPTPGAPSDAPGGPAQAEVIFTNGDTKLAGTLYRPQGNPSPPGVVILGGSDRGPRGPQKERLARYLAEHGISALIYDSPGTGKSGGKALVQRRLDRVAEAGAAVRFLRSAGNVDSTKVGLVGGSEGALVALLAAGTDPEIAYAVLISGGFGVSMMDQARYRIEAMGRRRGLSRDRIDRALVLEELLYSLFTKHGLAEEGLLREKAAGWPGEPWNGIIELVARAHRGMNEDEQGPAWDTFRRTLRSWQDEPWFQVAVVDRGSLSRLLALDATAFFSLLDRGPLAAGDDSLSTEELAILSHVHPPLLAVWGEEDEFLPPKRCAAWLEATLGAAGHPDLTVTILPGADHVLCVPGSEGKRFARGYPRVVADWIRGRVRINARD